MILSLVWQLRPAIIMLALMTLVLGVAYPAVISAVALKAPDQAAGSLIVHQEKVVGSSLLGQPESGPEWFQGRPSASNASGETSGGTNDAVASADYAKKVADREKALRAANPQASGPVPSEALAASGSGLDPHISPAYAQWQVPRVAQATGLAPSEIEKLIAAHTETALGGVLGSDRVNVTTLNVALEQARKR